MDEKKKEYEKPAIEIIEFVLEDSIAASNGAFWNDFIWDQD